MSGGMPVSLACCGLLGTVAQDGGMVERAFAEACATQGIVPGTAGYAHCMVAVHQSLGQPAVGGEPRLLWQRRGGHCIGLPS